MTDIAQQNRTFYTIADDLAAYFESLDMAEAQLAIAKEPEERKELEAGRAAMLAQIERLGGELALKAEAVAGVIRRLKSEAELLSAEEMALTRRRLVVERSEAWLKQYVIAAMRNAGVTQVKATKATLRIQRNGGVQPVVISDESKIPDDCRMATVKMSADEWKVSREHLLDIGMTLISEKVEIDNTAIRESIMDGYEVPGAHLAERGEHLRIT